MRKTLAVVLSSLMILSLLCIGVSAAEGTAIKTAEDFAAMTADGTYYLDADIAITASYGAGDTVVPFTGTLDGNGHTVTVSEPMFVQLAGTVKNLTVNGAVTKTGTANETASYAGAIANHAPKNSTVVIENVVNNATVTFKYRGGAFIGQVSDGTTLTVTNCVNNGAILGGNMAGGFVGYMQGNTAVFTDCVNNGSVTIDVASSLTGLAAGIVGRFGGDNAFNAANERSVTITNCLNTGAITGTTQAAGILAHVRGAYLTIKNCTNKGEITSTYNADNGGTSDAGGIFGSTGDASGYYSLLTIDKCVNEGKITSKNARAAGIAGYVWCGNYEGRYMHAELTDCVNKGDIYGGSFVSQMLAYTNDAKDVSADGQTVQPTIIHGVGLGTVNRSAETKRDPEPNAEGKNSTYFALVGLSSSAFGTRYNFNLVLADTDKTAWTCYSEGTPANRHGIDEKPDTVKFVPAAEAAKAAAAFGEIGYKAPASPEQPSDPTTPDTPATPTGDSLVAVVAVAAVALFGMAVAVKKKEN